MIFALVSATAHAGTVVVVESVNAYPAVGNPLFNSLSNGAGFQNTMLVDVHDGSPYTRGPSYTNQDVLASDFLEVAYGGADWLAFDAPGTAIAYFTGHGVNQAGGTALCSSSAECTTPPPGASGPGVCRSFPDALFASVAVCMYDSDRFLVTDSPSDVGGQHFVNYSGGAVAFGESPSGGAWAGAGTDGGVNLVVLDISHGVSPLYWVEQLRSAFAGVHLIATLMPVAGDTANVSTRGAAFANQRRVNPHGSVGDAWLEALNSLPLTQGGACGPADYSAGGGHGFNGCGCNFVMSMDSTKQFAISHRDEEDWYYLQQDSWDADGDLWYAWSAMCNYDVQAFPWAL